MVTRMRTRHLPVIALAALLVLLPRAVPLGAAQDSTYQAGFHRWRAADNGFRAWTMSGVAVGKGGLQIDASSAKAGTDPHAPGTYHGRNFYNGGSYVAGEATSPEMTTSFPFFEAIPSWNAETPAGTWIETLLRARVGSRWTKWYNLGVWASDTSVVQRHSIEAQRDADGDVSTDTLVLSKNAPADAYQAMVRLFTAAKGTTPTVRNMSVAFSLSRPKKAAASATSMTTENRAAWGTKLSVPTCSQMVYKDGGNVWCSPTSSSMVLGFWGIDPGACEQRVRKAVAGVYDFVYDGHGNWPFNTAYAASRGLEAYALRFTSLADVEPWVKAGVPVVFSFSWRKNELTGAAVPSSNGHLAVIVGFDPSGNPIVNDPAAATDAAVPRVYQRAELEAVWLTGSGGLVYLIYPAGHKVPVLR